MGQWQSQPVCTTPACIHAASQALRNLAPNWEQMDPCTEFEQMVCYGTSEHSGMDGGTMNDVDKRNKNILRKILESDSHAQAAGVKSTLLTARSNSEEFNFDMLRTSYQACMDTDALAAAGTTPLAEVIVSINKTWPISPSDLKTKVGKADFDGLHKAMLATAQLGIPVFHSECGMGPVMPDYLNSKLNRVCYGTPSVTLDDLSLYLVPETLKDYAETVATAFSVVFPDLDTKTVSALAEAVVEFEADVVKVAVPILEAAAGNTSPYESIKNVTLADIGKSAPALGFDKLIAALTPTGKTPSVMLLDKPDFWPVFSKTITQHSRAAVHGYVMWKIISSLAPEVDAPVLAEIFGLPTYSERWTYCVASADQQLRHILDSYFVAATYPDLTLKAAAKMTNNIKTQFEKRLGELDWMSPESRKNAIQKSQRILQNIGYPTENPDLRSADSMASYYATFNASASHFANTLSARRLKTVKGYEQVARDPNRKEMDDITQVNAFYDPSVNAIIIPAGISQLPIFHYHLPDYVLYGGLGSVIGHEITHGFDNNGRLWSQDAEYEAWWDNSTIQGFEERAQCFVDQYSSFEVEVPSGKANVDGQNTLGENLADAGGLRAAYNAWVEERKAMPSSWDQDLPGLEGFTHEQLFFIFYGNMWCSAKSPETVEALLPDVHAPSPIRILGATQNSKAFREAFKCKSPEPKCELF